MPAERPKPDVSAVVPAAGSDDRYAALNDAAASAGGEWLLFGGADLDAARAAVSDPTAADAAVLDAGPGRLLVRRAAFESAGGFHEGVLAGGELDLVLRLRHLGWPVRAPAGFEPHGATARWIGRRHRALTGRGLRGLWARFAGENRTAARRRTPAPATGAALVVFTDAYPARSETFVYREVAALRELGWRVRVEASARPARVEREAARAGRTDYLEDDPPLHGLVDLLWLAARHPLRCLADLRDRRRWAREDDVWPLRSLSPAARRLAAGGEAHVHVHFAAGAALHVLRIARITGVTWSVAGHGYDVFSEPRNLDEKLAAAEFVVGPCEYTAGFLRERLPAARRGRVHVVVMGVDGEAFRRSRPHPRGRTVVAIGRLVEKKGFSYLIEAAGMLDGDDALERLAIAGDGPLRGELEAAIEASGLVGRADIVDAWGTEPIRELLQGADLLAMPAVIAADGDRDAMPVVVKEALAMEVPVVATDEVGLPELVRAEWGTLVPPRDPTALARGIAELLALPPEIRARMGAAGRAHVLAHCDVRRETAKLAGLVESTVAVRAARR